MPKNADEVEGRLRHAEQMAARWLHLGNLASERGDRGLAERTTPARSDGTTR